MVDVEFETEELGLALKLLNSYFMGKKAPKITKEHKELLKKMEFIYEAFKKIDEEGIDVEDME